MFVNKYKKHALKKSDVQNFSIIASDKKKQNHDNKMIMKSFH